MSRSAGEIMALLIMAVCTILKALHGFKEKRVHKTRHAIQNVENEILKILKMFKYNKKSTRATCSINSKLHNRDKNTTLVIYLFCHYC